MKFWSLIFHSATIVLLYSSLSMKMAQAQGSPSLEKGVTQYQAGDYPGAIEHWKQALQQTTDPKQQAVILENLARSYQKMGQSKSELDLWNQLITLHQQTQDRASLARIWTEKAQALSRQGQSQTAMMFLCDHENIQDCSEKSAIGLARRLGNQATEVAALGSLGEAHRLQGDFNKAIERLELALKLAKELKIPAFEAAAQNSLGNTYTNRSANHYRKSVVFAVQEPQESQKIALLGQEADRKALQHYQASLALVQTTDDRTAQFQALIHVIPIYQRLGDRSTAQKTWETAAQSLSQLPTSRMSAYGAIDLAKLLQSLGRSEGATRSRCGNPQQSPQVEALLQKAQSIATTIGDQRARSFALGALGDLAECDGRWDQALSASQQAILAAGQGLADRDSLYLWEWQRGRILNRQGDRAGAIAAYDRAIVILEQVRRELVNVNRDVQFDFRDTIDPIYRELVDLRLSQETTTASTIKPNGKSSEKTNLKDTQSNNLQSTLATLDALKLAELQNYFGNDCVISYAKDRIDKRVQSGAAVLTTVIGEERTAVILSLPNGERKFSWIQVKRSELEKTVETYRIGLESFDLAPQGYNPAVAQKLYGWLVAPFEQELLEMETLVFVQDGLLRSVPMAALHDGKQFLIEKVAIATAPSLSLVDAKVIDRNNLNILALGLTQEATIGNRYFQPLKQVQGELQGLTQSFPRTTILLDKAFNRSRMKTALQDASYSILHIATHGKFGIEAEDTFFVTGDLDETQQRFNLNELEQLIRRVSKNTEPLDLLVLTACETAIGDDRSALGLAGVAVQSGASSAIASLWAVNDNTTAQLSTALYSQLANPKVSKSQALQRAQVQMIQRGGVTAHPYYWSAFVLVGNWL